MSNENVSDVIMAVKVELERANFAGRKITLRELAQRTGINHCHISNILLGKTQPGLPVAEKLCRAVGLTIVALPDVASVNILDDLHPPSDGIAYVEDGDDRLWTGRGGDIWTCLTGSLTGVFMSWRSLWWSYGPLTPLGRIVDMMRYTDTEFTVRVEYVNGERKVTIKDER